MVKIFSRIIGASLEPEMSRYVKFSLSEVRVTRTLFVIGPDEVDEE